jgi:GxxExxY protein
MLYKDEVYQIQGAAFEVYNQLGWGFLESVYQEALERELTNRSIPFVSQARLTIFYKGAALEQVFIADLICFDRVVVELKAVSALNEQHLSQVLNYLKATRQELGLLLNFGAPKGVEYKRVIRTH